MLIEFPDFAGKKYGKRKSNLTARLMNQEMTMNLRSPAQ